MLLKISHETCYSYSQPVDYALQKVRLHPLSSVMQNVIDWRIEVAGGKIETSYSDHYGNHTDLVSADRDTQSLVIRASGQVSTQNTSGVLGRVYGRAPLWHFMKPTPLTEAGPGIAALADVCAGHSSTLDGLHALTAAVLDAVPYEIGKTATGTTAQGALDAGFGVCQDHAHIFIAAARAAGLAARYVSGYLMMDDRIDQDASHAWAEAHVEGLGWVGFDVSNGVCPDERYVRLAIGRDSGEAAPISGLRHGTADESMMVSVQVQQ